MTVLVIGTAPVKGIFTVVVTGTIKRSTLEDFANSTLIINVVEDCFTSTENIVLTPT